MLLIFITTKITEIETYVDPLGLSSNSSNSSDDNDYSKLTTPCDDKEETDECYVNDLKGTCTKYVRIETNDDGDDTKYPIYGLDQNKLYCIPSSLPHPKYYLDYYVGEYVIGSDS